MQSRWPKTVTNEIIAQDIAAIILQTSTTSLLLNPSYKKNIAKDMNFGSMVSISNRFLMLSYSSLLLKMDASKISYHLASYELRHDYAFNRSSTS